MDNLEKLDLFIKELRMNNKSEMTIKDYLTHIKLFLDFIKKPIDNITYEDIINFLSMYRNPYTLNLKKSAIKRFIRFSISDKSKRDLLLEKIKPSIVRRLTPERFLSEEEVKKVIDAVKRSGNEKHLAIFRLLYGAGIRVSECVNLKRQDINLETGYMIVRRGKGGKTREFPEGSIAPVVLSGIRDYLQTRKDESEYLFLGYEGKHLEVRSIQKMCRLYGKKAGIQRTISPHCFRHSFITHLLDRGANLFTLKELVGHVELDPVYVHLAEKKHFENVMKKHPFFDG